MWYVCYSEVNNDDDISLEECTEDEDNNINSRKLRGIYAIWILPEREISKILMCL